MVIVSDILLPKNADGILKVSDVSTSADSDLSARTDITDPNSSIFVKTDVAGRLNILESNIEGAGVDNSLNATEFAVSQMGAFDGSGYRVAKCSNVGRLEVDINSGASSGDASAANQTNGNQKTQVFGIDPSNNQVQLSVENGGKAQVQVVGSNDINGGLPHRHLTIDANGRTLTNPIMTATNNAIGTTNTLLNGGLPSALSSAGNLKVSLTEIEAGIVNPINVASKHENAFLEILTAGSVTSGNSIITSAHTLSAGASSSGIVPPVTIYVHFGAGTSDSNFTVEVHKSYDGTVYFVDTNFTFSPVGSNTNNPPTVEPAVVANGNSDGRFIKVKITNNSEANPTSVDVFIIERQ